MSLKLHPNQITGNIIKPAQDMLYHKRNASLAGGSVFGEAYFDTKPPAKTFRQRNRSLAVSKTPRMEPMLIKKNLHLANGWNYPDRKFHLQSDKVVDKLMPTDMSVANLLY